MTILLHQIKLWFGCPSGKLSVDYSNRFSFTCYMCLRQPHQH
jgi:hypothetical protein